MKINSILKDLIKFLKELDELAQKGEIKKGKVEFMGTDITYSYSVRYLSPYNKPLVDIIDKKDHIVVTAFIPNIREEDLKFEIEDNKLQITVSIGRVKFLKTISIPENSKVDRILSTSFKDGVLKIILRKKFRNSKDKD